MDKGHDKRQMSDREAMKLALEALEHWMRIDTVEDMHIFETVTAPEAIAVLRQALEQPEREPVTWRNAAIRLGEDLYSVGPNGYYDMTASQWLDWALSVVNTAPPKREWVELTFEEADRLASKYSSGFRSDHNDALHLVGEVEALLKEKNT